MVAVCGPHHRAWFAFDRRVDAWLHGGGHACGIALRAGVLRCHSVCFTFPGCGASQRPVQGPERFRPLRGSCSAFRAHALTAKEPRPHQFLAEPGGVRGWSDGRFSELFARGLDQLRGGDCRLAGPATPFGHPPADRLDGDGVLAAADRAVGWRCGFPRRLRRHGGGTDVVRTPGTQRPAQLRRRALRNAPAGVG